MIYLPGQDDLHRHHRCPKCGKTCKGEKLLERKESLLLPPFRKHNFFLPGACGCCGSCEIFSDNFDRADNADPGSDWTEVSGTSAISSNQLVFTAAGVILCNTAHPDGDSSMVVEVDFRHNALARTCDVLVAVVDSSNYFYARYTVQGASGGIAIRRNNGGSHSQILAITTTINTNTTYAARVCVSENGSITASLNGNPRVTAFSQPVSGSKCGLGCNVGGTATFNNFSFQKSRNSGSAESCEGCRSVCIRCNDSSGPVQLQLTVPPGTVVDDTCDDCDNANGIFVLDRVDSVAGTCVWRSADFAVPCPNPLAHDLASWAVGFSTSGGDSTLRAHLQVRGGGGNSGPLFGVDIPGTLIDCNIEGLELPYLTGDILNYCESAIGQMVVIDAL